MKVKDLCELLSSISPEKDVYCSFRVLMPSVGALVGDSGHKIIETYSDSQYLVDDISVSLLGDKVVLVSNPF